MLVSDPVCLGFLFEITKFVVYSTKASIKSAMVSNILTMTALIGS